MMVMMMMMIYIYIYIYVWIIIISYTFALLPHYERVSFACAAFIISWLSYLTDIYRVYHSGYRHTVTGHQTGTL